MEGNKDESEKCLRIAEKCIRAGEKDKAVKFLQKAEKLYPSQRAKGEWQRTFTCVNKRPQLDPHLELFWSVILARTLRYTEKLRG